MRYREIVSRIHGQLSCLFQALRWRAHWLAPNLIRINSQDDDEYERKCDKESNEAGRVPEEDQLRIRMIWGVEVYGPNEIEGLYKALKALGWGAEAIGSDKEGALRWVQQQRIYGLGGSYNVGLVVGKSESRRWLGINNEADLPNGIEYLLVRIYQFTPAITCLVVGFALNEETARRYETELNLDRRSRRERGKKWSISYLEPSHLKQRAIAGARIELRCLISDWFSRTIPGYFSTQGSQKNFPFAELLTTAGDDIFAERKFNIDLDWRRILVNASLREIWTSMDISALKFVLKRPGLGDTTRNWIVAGASVVALPKDKLKHYGGGISGVANFCYKALVGPLACFGVLSYLSELSRDLKVAREELHFSKSRRRTLEVIERIQRFFDGNAGVPVAAREIRDVTMHPGLLTSYCGQFTAINYTDENNTRDFAKELQVNLHRAAAALIEDESSTREHFEQLSTVLSIRESVRAQRRMEWVALLGLLVALISLLVAVISLMISIPESWSVYMKELFLNFTNHVV